MAGEETEEKNKKSKNNKLYVTAGVGLGLAIAGGVWSGGIGAIPGIIVAAPATATLLVKAAMWAYNKCTAGVKRVKNWWREKRDGKELAKIKRIARYVGQDVTQARHKIHSLEEMKVADFDLSKIQDRKNRSIKTMKKKTTHVAREEEKRKERTERRRSV